MEKLWKRIRLWKQERLLTREHQPCTLKRKEKEVAGLRQGLTGVFLRSCNTWTCWVRNNLAKPIFLSFLLMWSMKGTITSRLKQSELLKMGCYTPRLQELFCIRRAPAISVKDIPKRPCARHHSENSKLIKTSILQLLYANSLHSYPESKKSIVWFYWIIKFSLALDDIRFLQSFTTAVVLTEKNFQISK